MSESTISNKTVSNITKSNKFVYIATFDNDGEYITVNFPDVEGAFTQGENFNEAFKKANEVLGSVLSGMNEYPVSSTSEEIKRLYPDSMLGIVEVDLEVFRRKYRSNKVRRNISLPEWLNDLANDTKINVSEVTVEALK